MNTPYLIQRANFTIDDKKEMTLSFDYMGSAEFEFGNLPASYKRVKSSINEYEFFHIIINKQSVHVFGKIKDKEKIIEWLKLAAEEKQSNLKEYIKFHLYIYPEKRKSYDGKKMEDFWWDIENDFFFWKANNKFKDEFIEELKSKE